MKVCSKCNQEKEYSQFHKESKTRSRIGDGYRAACKVCTNKQNVSSWYKHHDKRLAKKKEYRENNREKTRSAIRRHYYNNKEYYEEKSINRINRLRMATITDENMYTIINRFRKKARIMTEQTGIKYSIDHIIPLVGDNVSGLNVPWNIQVIPLLDNKIKGNRYGNN